MMDAKRGEMYGRQVVVVPRCALLISIQRVALSLVTVSGNNDNLISNSNNDIMYITTIVHT